jgi:hypothetical protein
MQGRSRHAMKSRTENLRLSDIHKLLPVILRITFSLVLWTLSGRLN